MERLTEKRDGKNVIALRQDGKIKWVLCSAGINIDGISTQFLYGEYSDCLAEYEDTGLTPAEIEQLKSQLAEAMELLEQSTPFVNSYSGWWSLQNYQDRYEKLKGEVEKNG